MIILVGLFVSFAAFITALEVYHNDLKADFKDFATLQNDILVKAMETLFTKMRLVNYLYLASDNLEVKRYKSLVETISAETAFDAFVVLEPNQKGKYDTKFFAGRVGIDKFKHSLSIIATQLPKNFSTYVSAPFIVPGQTSSSIALSIPMNQGGDSGGQIFTGILNLDNWFKLKAALQSSARYIHIYAYQENDLSKPFYTFGGPDDSSPISYFKESSLSLDSLKKSRSVYYETSVHLGGESWTILYVPTEKYIVSSVAIFPWLVLISGIAIVSLLGYYSFKLAETVNKLKRTSEELIENEALTRNIVDYAVDGLIIIDASGVIERFNPSCQRIFQYRENEIQRKKISLIVPALTQDNLEAHLGENPEIGAAIRKELTGKRKDGTTFPLDISFSAVIIQGKQMFNGIIRDITDRKEGEEIKEKLIQQLIESNIELEKFAYIASHDLQEPLRTITNYTSLLVSTCKDVLDKESHKYMEICMNAAKRMHELVSSLLEYAKLGQNIPRSSLVDCNKILESVLLNLADVIKERHAQITYDKLPEIWGNAILLMSLFQNLINNGLKYQSENNTPKIMISAMDNGDHWLFSVQDNGIGISAKYLEQIFMPFKRLHTKHDFPGSGIGLSTCKRIINKFGGKIWVASILGEGSTFYFTLPKTPVSENDTALHKLTD